MVDTQKVGAFIAQCRKECKWTQKELGEKLGVTDKAVSKWENGRSFPDITLLELLCETLDISISELLAGKRIPPKDYKKETEHLLIQSIGEKRLTGFQIGIYLLGLVTIILGGVGVGISAANSSWKIGPVNIHWIFIVAALLTFGVMVYFDRNLPGKNYRKSNICIEIIVEVFFLICICGGSIFSTLNVDNMIEKIISFLIIAAIVGCSLAIRIIGAHRNREENQK